MLTLMAWAFYSYIACQVFADTSKNVDESKSPRSFFCVICPKTAKGLNGLMKWTKKTGVRTRKKTELCPRERNGLKKIVKKTAHNGTSFKNFPYLCRRNPLSGCWRQTRKHQAPSVSKSGKFACIQDRSRKAFLLMDDYTRVRFPSHGERPSVYQHPQV